MYLQNLQVCIDNHWRVHTRLLMTPSPRYVESGVFDGRSLPFAALEVIIDENRFSYWSSHEALSHEAFTLHNPFRREGEGIIRWDWESSRLKRTHFVEELESGLLEKRKSEYATTTRKQSRGDFYKHYGQRSRWH